MHNPKAKLKTLYVMRILQDETDAKHGLSLRGVIERLDDYGIQAGRKFLAKRQSRALTTNLKLLASDHEMALLDRRIHVPGRITSKNDSVFGCNDTLHEAMRKHQKVEFMYYKYNVDGNRYATHDGKPHLVTPVGITYDDGHYYLTAWNDDHEAMTEFRIDRMEKLRVSDERATKNEQITHHTYEGDEQ